MIRILTLVALVGLVACEQTTQAVDGAARRSAKGVVTETIATRVPSVPKQLITPFTDCVIDNASANEIGEFAKAAVLGVTDETAVLVRSVIERPETQNCILGAGRTALSL